MKNNEDTIKDLQTSVEFTQNLRDDKIKDFSKEWETKMETFKENVKEKLCTTDSLKEKLRVLEDRGRRNNLKIDGINESEKETWEECEEKIKEVLEKHMKINGIEIERAHRMGRKQHGEERPRTIIFKLLNWKQKELILKNTKHLKNTGIYINEDFSDATIEIRKKLVTEIKNKDLKVNSQ